MTVLSRLFFFTQAQAAKRQPAVDYWASCRSAGGMVSTLIQRWQQGRILLHCYSRYIRQPYSPWKADVAPCLPSAQAVAVCWWIGGANLFLPKRPLCAEVSGFNWLVHTFSSRPTSNTSSALHPPLFGSWCQQGSKCLNSFTHNPPPQPHNKVDC